MIDVCHLLLNEYCHNNRKITITHIHYIVTLCHMVSFYVMACNLAEKSFQCFFHPWGWDQLVDSMDEKKVICIPIAQVNNMYNNIFIDWLWSHWSCIVNCIVFDAIIDRKEPIAHTHMLAPHTNNKHQKVIAKKMPTRGMLEQQLGPSQFSA